MPIPYLDHINLNKNELQNAVVQRLNSDPGSPVEAQIYYNTTSDKIRYYDGAAWQDVGSGSGTGDVSSIETSTTDGQLVVFNSTGGKSIKKYTLSGILKTASGVVSTASAGTDYTTPSSTESFTNKTFDANGTGNSISNIETADFASGVIITSTTLS